MIDTAVFSWKGPTKEWTLFHIILWCWSVNSAAKHFKDVILVSDKDGQKFLSEKLQLPFSEIIDLPSITDELTHIYDLPKLHALNIVSKGGRAAIHIDHDAILRRKLPNDILASKFICEFKYNPRPLTRQINSSLPIPRLSEITTGLAHGVFGGCDLDKIIEFTEKSIDIATDERNREFLKQCNGYEASVLFGEVSSGDVFGDTCSVLLPSGELCGEDYRKIGYIHLAGNLKKDKGVLAQAAFMAQLDFPNECSMVSKLFDDYNWTR